MMSYVEVECFEDFRKNQNELIKILNHNMTKMTADVSWIKKIMNWQIGILTAIGLSTFISMVS